jgi:hypothetical protein
MFYRSKDDPAIWAEYHPAKGDLIVFDNTIWHEGEQLLEGQKFVLRSDILYETTDLPAPAAASRDFAEGHLGYIWKVLPFDANHVVSGGRDTVLKVWDQAGRCTQRLEGHRNSVLCLAKLNDTTLLSGSRDTTIKVWEQHEGQFQLARTLQLHHTTVLSLARLTNDTFVSAGADGLIRVCNAAGAVLRTLSGHTDWVWQTLPLPGANVCFRRWYDPLVEPVRWKLLDHPSLRNSAGARAAVRAYTPLAHQRPLRWYAANTARLPGFARVGAAPDGAGSSWYCAYRSLAG